MAAEKPEDVPPPSGGRFVVSDMTTNEIISSVQSSLSSSEIVGNLSHFSETEDTQRKFSNQFAGRWGEKWESENILELDEDAYPRFTLAKNKARFLRMVGWYKQRHEWLEVAPVSGVTKLFKQQTKELEAIRGSKMDYEMELEMGTLTPSQQSYRRDELKMCEVHERMAVSLISRMQMKIKSGRR